MPNTVSEQTAQKLLFGPRPLTREPPGRGRIGYGPHQLHQALAAWYQGDHQLGLHILPNADPTLPARIIEPFLEAIDQWLLTLPSKARLPEQILPDLNALLTMLTIRRRNRHRDQLHPTVAAWRPQLAEQLQHWIVYVVFIEHVLRVIREDSSDADGQELIALLARQALRPTGLENMVLLAANQQLSPSGDVFFTAVATQLQARIDSQRRLGLPPCSVACYLQLLTAPWASSVANNVYQALACQEMIVPTTLNQALIEQAQIDDTDLTSSLRLRYQAYSCQALSEQVQRLLSALDPERITIFLSDRQRQEHWKETLAAIPDQCARDWPRHSVNELDQLAKDYYRQLAVVWLANSFADNPPQQGPLADQAQPQTVGPEATNVQAWQARLSMAIQSSQQRQVGLSWISAHWQITI